MAGPNVLRVRRAHHFLFAIEKCVNTACGKIICGACAKGNQHWCPHCSNPTKKLET